MFGSFRAESGTEGTTEMTYLCLGVAVRPELRRLAEKTAAEPRTVSLPLVRDDLDLETTAAGTAAAELAVADPGVHQLLDISL